MKCVGRANTCLCQIPAHIVPSWPLIHVIWNRGADSSQKKNPWASSLKKRKKKEATPLLTIRCHGLKIAPLWKNTLSRRSERISYSACAPQIGPPFISPKDYDYSPISTSCQPGPDGFSMWSSRQKQGSPQLVANTCWNHVSMCSRSVIILSPGTFSFHCGFLATITKNKCDASLKGERPVNFLYLQQNLRQSLFVSHLGIRFTEHRVCLHGPALNKDEQVEGLTKRSFEGFFFFFPVLNSQCCRWLLFYLKDLFPVCLQPST